MSPLLTDSTARSWLSPGVRIALMGLVLPVGLAVLAVVQGGGVMGALSAFAMSVLAATLGPYMALTFPFDELTRGLLALGLGLAPIMVLIGWRNRRALWGQLVAGGGLFCWTLCGFLGLGTGT